MYKRERRRLEFAESSGLSVYPIVGEAYSPDNRIPHDLCCQSPRKDQGRRWVIKQRLEKPKEGFDVPKKVVPPKKDAQNTQGRWDNRRPNLSGLHAFDL
jgi:hypothetical protein